MSAACLALASRCFQYGTAEPLEQRFGEAACGIPALPGNEPRTRAPQWRA
jgi:hypothetical protein